MLNRLLYRLTSDDRVLGLDVYNQIRPALAVPLWLAFFLGVLACAAAYLLYRRTRRLTPGQRRTLTTLRALVYILLLFLLLTPQLVIRGEGQSSGPAPVILDRTESMGIADLADNPRIRLAAAVRKKLQARGGGAVGLEQVHYAFGEDLQPWAELEKATEDAPRQPETAAGITLSGRQTSLAEMMTEGFKNHRGLYSPGMILVTDGAHNTGVSPQYAIAEMARRGVPVYAIPVGRQKPRDVALTHLITEDLVFVDETFQAFVAMNQHGYTGTDITARAWFGDQRLEDVTVVPGEDGEMSFPVECTPGETGTFELKVEVPPDRREITPDNNVVTRKVRVIKDRIRVLLMFGRPSWEYRFLRGAFERDRRVDQEIYLRDIDPRLLEERPETFLLEPPATEEALFRKYDIVFISDLNMHKQSGGFSALLKQFVAEEGGGVVIVSDGRHLPFSLIGTDLEPLLPVRLTRAGGQNTFRQEMTSPQAVPYKLKVLPQGQGHPLVVFDPDHERNMNIWNNFPPIYELCPPAELKPSALPLVEAREPDAETGRPAVVYQSYGKGMVLYMGFDATWRWRKEFGDRYFRGFWGRVVQFMGLPHRLDEAAQSRLYLNRIEANVGEKVIVTASVRSQDYSPYLAENVTATVQHEEAETRDVVLNAQQGQPGVFRGNLFPEQEGKLVFRLPTGFNASPAELQVNRVSREYASPGVDLELLHRIAAETGGKIYTQLMEPDTEFRPDNAEDEIVHEQLMELRGEAERQQAVQPDDEEYIERFVDFVLKDIARRRPSVSITVEASIWDRMTVMLAALIVLCLEYFFRKRWYLD